MTTEEKIEETISKMCLFTNIKSMTVAHHKAKYDDADTKFEAERKKLLLYFTDWRAEIKAEVKKEMGYEL